MNVAYLTPAIDYFTNEELNERSLEWLKDYEKRLQPLYDNRFAMDFEHYKKVADQMTTVKIIIELKERGQSLFIPRGENNWHLYSGT